MHWHGKDEITVQPLMKKLTFNLICSLIFGIDKGPRRDLLENHFEPLGRGVVSIPVNLPFTRFNRSLRARAKLNSIILELVREIKEALRIYGASSDQDLITCLLNSTREGDTAALSVDEILDNVILMTFAGHDTTSVLLTLLIRLFTMNPSIYAAISQEHEQIEKCKHSGDLLTWDDLIKMKQTWRVAMEVLRITPPGDFGCRTVVKDTEYDGYVIPKGWQVMWAAAITHMDEKIFKDPTEFDMTRFEQQPPPYSFLAFGGGSRICPGYEFVKIETLVMIHYLVRRFSWEISTNDSFFREPFIVFKQGLPIRIASKTI